MLLTTRGVPDRTSLEGYSSLFPLANKELGIFIFVVALVGFWGFVSFSPQFMKIAAYLDHDFPGNKMHLGQYPEQILLIQDPE